MSDAEVALRIWHLLDGKAKETAVDALATFLGNVREQHAAELREAEDLLREEHPGDKADCRACAFLARYDARNPGGDR